MSKKLDSTLPKDLQSFDIAKAGVAPDSDNSNSSVGGETTETNSRAGIESDSETPSLEQEPNKHGEKSMAQELNKDDIKNIVKAMLAEDDAEKQVETKFASLEAEKAELAQKLEASETANDKISSELEDSKAALDSSKEANEALAKEKEESVVEASAAKQQLEEIRIEKTIASRTQTLEESKILLVEGAKRDGQLEKVKPMSDEAFASYVEELVDIAGLKADAVKEEESTGGEEDIKADANKDEVPGSQTVATASVADGTKYQNAIAAASSQVVLDNDMVQTYASM